MPTGNTSRSKLRASEDLTSRQGAGEEGETREEEGERGGERRGRAGGGRQSWSERGEEGTYERVPPYLGFHLLSSSPMVGAARAEKKG